MNKLYVIGIGYRPLDKRAREIIYNSDVILASTRLFEIFERYDEFKEVKEKIRIIDNVYETLDFIRSQTTSIALLASGDPLFFGIGRMLLEEFDKDRVEILPDLSSIQVAFSRIKELWGDALFISLHGGPDPDKRRKLEYEISDIPSLLERYPKIGILTDRVNNPAVIAKQLLLISHPSLSNLRMYVCEKLGYPDENLTEGTPETIAKMSFSDPNIVVLIRDDKKSSIIPCFGLSEDMIQYSKGLITKDEVRAITIHKLQLPQKGVFWDVGAGSGSVSIEAARMNPGLRVFAIERDNEQVKNIKENIKRFEVFNIEVIKGEAPGVLDSLPAPDRVFIGGSGKRLKDIINLSVKKGVKLMVVNATTIETLNDALKFLEKNGFDANVCEVSISRSKIINQKRHMSAHNPVFIIIGEKTS